MKPLSNLPMFRRSAKAHAMQAHSPLAGTLLLIGLLLISVFVGLAAAVIPAGTLVRLVAIPCGIGVLFLVWALPKRSHGPDGLAMGVLTLLMICIHLWPQYIFYRFGGLPAISPTKFAWLAFLCVASFSALLCRTPMARLSKRCKAHPWLIGSLVIFMSWRIISALAGDEPLVQVWLLGSEMISSYLFFFLILAVIRDESDVLRLLNVLAVVALIQAGLASYESVVKHTLFGRFVSASSDDPATMASILAEKFRGGAYRAQGTFEHPMVLAEFLAMMVPLAVAVAARAKLHLRLLALGFIPLAIAMILASRSRSGIAVLLAAVVLVGLLFALPRNSDHKGVSRQGGTLVAAAFFLPVLAVGAYIAGTEIYELIAGRNVSEASSTMSRVLMFEKGIPLVLESPLFGYGNGLGAVKLGFFDGVRYNIDSYFLTVALDSGLPGFIAFGIVVIGGIALGLRLYINDSGKTGTTAGLIAISLVMFVGVKSVLSITSGFTLAFALIVSLIVLNESLVRRTNAAA